jgi:glucose-1-phosphate thymidylyltransferase
MYLGDNLLQGGITELVERFRRSEPDALILLTPVPDPESYGVAELDGDRVVALVEKPRAAQQPRAGRRLHVHGRDPRRRARDRAERSRRARDHRRDPAPARRRLRVESHIVRGWWKDTGQLADMLEANRLILDTIEPRCDGELTETQLDGRVIVEAGARLERSTVRGPAIIGAGAQLIDAYVGPYTAVGERCTIERAEVEHSILLADCSVHDLDVRIEESLLGRNVRVRRDSRQPRAYRLMVGDNSEIAVP